jgi:hypothetical protein
MHEKGTYKDFLACSVVPKQATKIRGEEFDLLYIAGIFSNRHERAMKRLWHTATKGQ